MRFEFLLGLMIEALVILFIAKLARDRMLKQRGYRVNDLIVRQRSLGAAITQAGYLIGCQSTGEAIVIDGRHVWVYTPSTTPGQVIRISSEAVLSS